MGIYQPVASLPLRDQVAEALTSMILDGRWNVGEYLPSQTQLAAEFAVSVPVIRESLQILKARGLVDVAHGKGVRVLPPNVSHASTALRLLASRGLATLRDLIELRFLLEPEIAALAATNATEKELDRLEEIIAPTLREDLALDEFLRAEIEFHRGLAQASGNSLLPLFMQVFTDLFQRFLVMALEQGPSNGPAEHKIILQALRARDPEAARQAMLDQLKNNRRHLLEIAQADAESGTSVEP